MAATTGIRSEGNASGNTASAGSDPEHARKRSSWRRLIASELPKPEIPGHSSSRCSMWRHLCSWITQARGADPECGHGGKMRSSQILHAASTAVAPKYKNLISDRSSAASMNFTRSSARADGTQPRSTCQQSLWDQYLGILAPRNVTAPGQPPTAELLGTIPENCSLQFRPPLQEH